MKIFVSGTVNTGAVAGAHRVLFGGDVKTSGSFLVTNDLASPITSVPTIEGYECVLADSMTLEVEVDKGQSLNEVFVSLSAHDVSVVSMRTKTNRLEELFVTMTSEGNQ